MDSNDAVGDADDWTSVTSKRKERIRKRSEFSTSSTTSYTILPARPRNSVKPNVNQVRKSNRVPAPSLPTASLLMQQNVLRVEQWYTRIRNLANSEAKEIIHFLVQNWATFKALMQNERFHNETGSVIEAMAVLSECDEFSDVEMVILMVLTRIRIKCLPKNCQGVQFFTALCRIFSSFEDRGSEAAKIWIREQRWVLIAIGEASNHLSHKDPTVEALLAKYQSIDERLTRYAPEIIAIEKNEVTESKSWDSPSSAKKQQAILRPIGPVKSQNQKGFENRSKNHYGFDRRNHNDMVSRDGNPKGFVDQNQNDLVRSNENHNGFANRYQNHTGGDNENWQPVKRRGKTTFQHNGKKTLSKVFYPVRSEICDPPLALMPLGKKTQHTRPLPTTDIEAKRKDMLLKAEQIRPQGLASYMDDIVNFALLLRPRGGTSLRDFISDVCKSPLLSNLQLVLSMEKCPGLTPTTVRAVINFCSLVLKACPEFFSQYFGEIVKFILQIADTFEEALAFPNIKKQISDLRGTLVHTTYVSNQIQLRNFRDMFVVPTAEDFDSREVFLRPNIVNGPYQSEQDYLDVQFRLLREDFLKPLRDGVAEIRGRVHVFEKSEEKRFNAMRIYRDVRFQKADRRAPGCLTMMFDEGRKLNIDWRISKRFMLGALLVISNDNFVTLHLARVARRDPESLSSGWLVIESLWSETSARQLCQGSFVVGESMVFFEPYLHVLNALQNTSSEMFPLARYIVYAEPTEELPDYLQDEDSRRYRIPLGGTAECGEREVDIVNGQWPTPADMGLNESQHQALVRALTQKVMLVQGPPGTGKTFLGLRIVRTLLMNPHAWMGSKETASPILIVCYTNHALDQFLVGLLSTTKKIVRLGGGCKDERLSDYILKRNEEQLSPDLKQRMRDRRREQETAEHDLQCIEAALAWLNDNIGIVSWESFMTYGVVNEESVKVPHGFSVVSWLQKGIEASSLSEEDKQFLKPHPKLGNKCFTFEDTFDNMTSSIKELQHFVDEGRLEYESTLQYSITKFEYLKKVVAGEPQMIEQNHSCNLLDLDAYQREQLYRVWVFRLREALMEAERISVKYLRDRATRVKQVHMFKDMALISSHLIVGMTTTKAAAMQPLLQELKPSIVVVEEAAEVLESHIIAALSPHVKHLILLGDHKQLRPSPADHVVAKDFKLEVSLFERLCNNNMPCKALNVQHRMRPEIASLIQFIYPGLENHTSVLESPSILGLNTNMFFVDHQMREQQLDELMSHSNPHEARFIAALVTYLLFQGYAGNQITILTAYSGQLMVLKGLEFEYPSLRQVRLCNVDNFQGEESDIILLSLVRSNPQNNIGFLKTENRVCVALSRAKHGMFIFGNLNALTASSETWRRVKSSLQSQGAVGSALTLRCVEHPLQSRQVRCGEDFKHWTSGGCELRCNSLLGCGHYCPFSCHRDRLEHQGIVCLEMCNKMICNKGHASYYCTRLCHEACEPCKADKDVLLDCQHRVKMKCGQDPRTYYCTMTKSITLECGHVAKMECAKDPKTFQCRKKEKRVLELCGHENLILCYRNGPCKIPCRQELKCGHLCPRDCHKFDDPLHQRFKCSQPCLRTRPGCSAERKHPCTLKCQDQCTECDVIITKILPCHHNMKMACAAPASQDRCRAKCPRQLPACKHSCRMLCGQECGSCEVQVERTLPLCGHKLTMLCYEDVQKQQCEKPCEKILPLCAHKCLKSCGKSCGPCSVKVLKKLPTCDHSIEVACGTNVEDVKCPQRCEKPLRCGHRCRSRCGDPCDTKCLKPVPCPSPCGHSVRVPCNEKDARCSPDISFNLISRCKRACTAKLVCGHQCKGSCVECYQGRIHRACQEKCGRLLMCGHRCEDICGQPCLPCKRPCPVKCIHSKCTKLCGQRCSPCSKKCEMGKPAFKCEKKCRDRCTWSPSNEPCMYPVPGKKCKHDCIGLHGDPCPSLCRICDEKEFEQTSKEDRFVWLSDCGHIVRLDIMESSIRERPTVLRLPSCPTCKVPVSNSSRYGNVVKERQEHIADIYKDLAKCNNNLPAFIELQTLAGITDRRSKEINACTTFDSPSTHKLMSDLREDVQTAEQSEHSDALARTQRGCNTFAAVLCLMYRCLRSVARWGKSGLRHTVSRQVDAVATVLAGRPHRCLSAQEVLDLSTEMLRIQRLQQLCMLEEFTEAEWLYADAEYLRVSKILRASGPYPRRTLDDAVERTIQRLAASSNCDVDMQWWEELPLPWSAAEGSWRVCDNRHVYPKTRAGPKCTKCAKEKQRLRQQIVHG